LAGRLANPAPTEPEQASFRRSISTAYYALFHLFGSGGGPVLEWLCHGTIWTMKDVSNAVWRSSWRGWSTPPPLVPKELETVAQVFVKLQESRQQADYDNAKIWEPIEVQATVADAQFAFISWGLIRMHPAANEYLLSLLIGTKRE
jgi:hypothetical protein